MDFGGTPNIDYLTEHCFAMNTNSMMRSCNRACNLPGVTNGEVENINQYFCSLPYSWLVDATDTATINMLDGSGLKHMFTFPAMSIDVYDVQPTEYKSGITVQEINQESDILTWISIVTRCYDRVEAELTKAIRYFIAQSLPESVRFYLGYYEGKAVAASMMILHEKIITLHFVGTLSEYRGKGLGSAITLRSLIDAQKMGYKQMILLSSAKGKALYEKMGFKEYAVYNVYCNVVS